nr:hypothetical protein [Tanacetum cinerariifolium]
NTHTPHYVFRPPLLQPPATTAAGEKNFSGELAGRNQKYSPSPDLPDPRHHASPPPPKPPPQPPSTPQRHHHLHHIYITSITSSATKCGAFGFISTNGQTATGKEISNPFMAGSLPKTTLSTFIHLMLLGRQVCAAWAIYTFRRNLNHLRIQTHTHLLYHSIPSIPSPTPPTPPPQPPQDIPSTSQVQSPPLQPQSPTLAQSQGADFPMSLLQEALDACAALTRRVQHLKHDKVAQALEIIKLKKRVKKLERANKVKVLKLRILKKVGTSQRVESSTDTDMEDASNQRRMIDELDRDEGVALMGEKEEEKKTEEVNDIAGDEQVKGMKAEIYQIYIGSNAKYSKTSSGRVE